jgi:hypothetical protein
VLGWLRTGPSLRELRDAYPTEWQTVQRRIAALADRHESEVEAFVSAATRPAPSSPGRARPQRMLLAEEIRRQMTLAALRQANVSAATGVTAGRVRFGRVNGYLAQRLLFARGLERKPVSMTRFLLTWPLLRQRSYLMPLVRPKGIYCFYSRRLISQLAAIIGDRPCLEIAAGDGTLSRFLAARGVDITATDDYSWSGSVAYPDDVQHLDAVKALRTHRPRVVVCSWPPAGNTFERHVFTTANVELYIVIGTRHEIGAGNWADYRLQDGFDLRLDEPLSRLVVPPDLDPAVYLFRRRTPVG